MSKKSEPMMLFKHLRNMQRIRSSPNVCTAERFSLDQIAAYNIHIDTGDTKASSNVILHEVPSFLIEAFTKFEQQEGCKVEGVFRKEGNSLRCKEDAMPVFFGAQSIPSNFLVHDVCSWIKKFFRELQKPLFFDREEKLMKFAEDLNGDVLVATLLSIVERLPASHMGAIGYLMRCLQEIAELSHLHQMTVDNLATVFAPSLFRGSQEKDMKMSKKRNGSQDDLLRSLKRTNDLQVKVVKVLIENAEKIGASDAKNRKLIASSMQRTSESSSKPGGGGAQMKIYAALMKKNSRSSGNLANVPSTSSLLSQKNSDDDSLNSPRIAKQKRSSSVVRLALSLKKSITNLTSDAFMSTPDLPGLTTKKIPKPKYHQQIPATQSVSASTCTSSGDNRRKHHPDYAGVNFQEIRKLVLPMDSKKRPPNPNFDNSKDKNKENYQETENSSTTKKTILRKRSSSGSKKKPMGVSNSSNIPASQSDHWDFGNVDGTEKHLNSNDPAEIQNTGVVNRRIQQFQKVSNNSPPNIPAARVITGNGNLSFSKPAEKSGSHGLYGKKTNANEINSEQPTKSQRFASNRAKSANSMYPTHQTYLDSARTSASVTSQASSPVSRCNPTNT